MKLIPYFLLLTVMTGCVGSTKLSTEAKARNRIRSLDEDSRNSINALIDMIDTQTAITDPGDKRYVPYEFRIAVDAKKRRQVHRIDPSLYFTKRSDYYLCIGENATKEKVLQIVALSYSYKIRFCPFE